eukprot:14411655-Alexandrium_andersonii.AAC.1
MLHKECAAHAFTLFFDTDCFMHQAHIIVRGALEVLDQNMARLMPQRPQPLRYYSTLAKIMHQWRDGARRIFVAWRESFGAEAALKYARKVPPKPLVGRWGNTQLCEDRLVSCDWGQLQSILVAELNARATRMTARASATNNLLDTGAALDELGLEEQTVYATKMSKWARDAVA